MLTKEEAQARLDEIEAMDLDNLSEEELAEILAEIETLSEIIEADEEKDEIADEIEDTKEDTKEETEEPRSCGEEDEAEKDDEEEIRSNTVVTEVRGFDPHAKEQKGQNNMNRTLEQRNAYREFIMNGTRSAELNLRTGDTANTHLIPMELQREIIRIIDEKEYGALYKAVRHMNVKGGVRFATTTFDPSFSWVADGSTANVSATSADDIQFTYNLCELRIQRTVLAQVTEIDEWESTLAEIIAEAFLKAMDYAILSGDGSGKPTGLLKKVDGNYVIDTITLDDSTATFEDLRKGIFGGLTGKEARTGTFVMTFGTWLWATNLAIAENYPVEVLDLNNKTLFGRPVCFVEDGLGLANVTTRTLTTGDAIMVYGDLKQYALNFNKNYEVVTWDDYGNNTHNTRVQCVVDGKPMNKKAFAVVVVGD